MSYIDLFLDSPYLFFMVLVVSLIITVLVYSAFPVIFAKTRKKTITKKKYKCLCYGVNIIGMVFFIVFNGVASGGPYLLWTWIFSKYGLKKLNKKGLLVDSMPKKENLSAKAGTENVTQIEENLPAEVEVEVEESKKTERKVKSNRDKKFVPFLKSRKKILRIVFFILTGVSVALMLASLIGIEISDSLCTDAIAHYRDTLTKDGSINRWFVGCGQYACKYCEGVKKVQYHSYYAYGSAHDFTYYRNVSNIYDISITCFYVFLVLSIVFAIISILLVIIPKVVDAKKAPKTVPQIAEKQNDSLFVRKKKINFCKYCGEKIDSDSMFCPYCGKKL